MKLLFVMLLICGACGDKKLAADTPTPAPTPAPAPENEVPANASPKSNTVILPGAQLGAGTAVEALSQTLAACGARDETKLWQIMAKPFRNDLTDLASRMASALSPAEFAEVHGYEEAIETLDVMTFLRVILSLDKEHENPCWKASTWKELAREQGPAGLAVLYELPNGHGRGVLLEKSSGGWLLAKITQSLKAEQYKSIVPNYEP